MPPISHHRQPGHLNHSDTTKNRLDTGGVSKKTSYISRSITNVSCQTYKRGIQISCRQFQHHDTKVFYMTFTCMTRSLCISYQDLVLVCFYLEQTNLLNSCLLGTWYYYVILRASTSVSFVRDTT